MLIIRARWCLVIAIGVKHVCYATHVFMPTYGLSREQVFVMVTAASTSQLVIVSGHMAQSSNWDTPDSSLNTNGFVQVLLRHEAAARMCGQSHCFC